MHICLEIFPRKIRRLVESGISKPLATVAVSRFVAVCRRFTGVAYGSLSDRVGIAGRWISCADHRGCLQEAGYRDGNRTMVGGGDRFWDGRLARERF